MLWVNESKTDSRILIFVSSNKLLEITLQKTALNVEATGSIKTSASRY
jgi:hypothetical protein